MNFETVKTFVWIGALFAIVLLFDWAWGERHDLSVAQAKIDKHEACLDALSGKGGVATICDPAVILYYDRARRADTCDQALALGGTAPECSAAVLDLAGNYATVQGQLQSTVADRDAAISRAAHLAAAQATRKSQDEHALAAAPRLPDGLIVCDAQCLRQRFEAAGD